MRFDRPLLLGMVLLFAGCAITVTEGPAPLSAPSCKGRGEGGNGSDCQILLKVVETTSKCRIEFVDRRQADVVFEAGRPNLWVLMQLETAGYRFPKKDGVMVRNDPFRNFRDGHAVGANDETFAILNVNSRLWSIGDYEYVVQAMHGASGRVCDLDPWFRIR